MPRLQNFGADKDLENNGNWIDIGGGQSLLIARLGNVAYTDELQRLMKPHLKELRRNEIPKQMMGLQKKAIAKTILLGWKGLKEVDGKTVEYSQDMALECLNDNQDFFVMVQDLAQDRENFQEKITEDSLGN